MRSSARPRKSSRSGPSGRARGVGLRRVQVHPVRDDPVAAAVEALGGPLRRLGDGDADVQLVVEPARADQRRDVVRDRAGRVAVERADHRRARRLDRVPADERRIRLVHVHDVVAAVAQLAAERGHRVRRDRQIRHGAVDGEPHRPAERDQVVGRGPRLRARAAMARAREAIIRVEWGKQADVVPLAEQLVGQSFDVPPDPARIRIRIGRDKRYAHRARLEHPSAVFLSRTRPQERVQLRQPGRSWGPSRSPALPRRSRPAHPTFRPRMRGPRSGG